MSESPLPENPFFTPFASNVNTQGLPSKFTYPFHYTPHPLSILASEEIQTYLEEKESLGHNFGLTEGAEGRVIGKMFGVLVVKTAQANIGYLAAFSGKLAGSFHHTRFVPPVFDSLQEGSFLNLGMQELTRINKQIGVLKADVSADNKLQISLLQELRKTNSVKLQGELFDQFHFLNQAGKSKSLRTIFQKEMHNNPPAGAGECAAPKLLHFAFQHAMQPIALAEFWWGLSPKSANWKHGQYYPACHEKCAPILAHMLTGIALDEAPV